MFNNSVFLGVIPGSSLGLSDATNMLLNMCCVSLDNTSKILKTQEMYGTTDSSFQSSNTLNNTGV